MLREVIMASISTEFRAIDALVNFKRTEQALARSGNRLSTGNRLEKSSDDIADFHTSNNDISEIKALRQVRRGNFEGINTIQIADGSLEEGINILTRIAEISTRSASDTLGGDNTPGKQANDVEFQELVAALDQLNNETRFNGTQLFGPTGLAFPVNMDGNSQNMTVTTTPIDSTTHGLAGTDILTTATASVVLTTATAAIESFSRQRGNLGTAQKRLVDNMDFLDRRIGDMQEQQSRLRDTNLADETVAVTQYQLQNQSNVAVISQANLSSEAVFQLLR